MISFGSPLLLERYLFLTIRVLFYYRYYISSSFFLSSFPHFVRLFLSSRLSSFSFLLLVEPRGVPLTFLHPKRDGAAGRGRLLDVSQRYARRPAITLFRGACTSTPDPRSRARLSRVHSTWRPSPLPLAPSPSPRFTPLNLISTPLADPSCARLGSPKPGRRLHTEGRAIAAIIAPASNRYSRPHLPF